MKHFYQNIGENWFSYAEFYSDMVKHFPEGSNFLEIGAWKGRSTVCMAVEIINSGKAIDFYTIDQWKYIPTTEQPVSSQEEFDIVFLEFLDNIEPVKNNIKVIKLSSEQASTLFDDNYFDFIFIDASHHYEDMKKDIQLWLPKIKNGRIISGHDYFTSVHPGVKQAVDELLPEAEKIKEQNVWFYQKTL